MAAARTHAPLPRRLVRPPVELELLIPAFNEQRRLPSTVAATVDYLTARPWSSAVVVVDNNSADGTLDVIGRFTDSPVPVHAIGCSDQGKGAAVRRGIETSSARFIGFADADNATPVDTLDRVMRLLRAGHGAVIASRHAPGARLDVEQPLLRRGGGLLFRTLAHLSLPGVADTQCGFKFFAGPLARSIVRDCHIDGFAFDVELLARVVRAGRDVVEVPVVWHDVPGSTFSARRDGLRSMADLLRISLAR
ncbi:glycosyltransferase [Streptomyces tanashiensis]|uniref:Glycosyltransferase n=1 Tax=Streptomyces tanashiensis TaxID=67367 RepID=A0ABY6RAC9_9ACTN|nr:glycosyltransferase [Streptomyces tanashiensis]UZX26722.1 glycosyltransferase [Streptomyces tanashiensis]GGY26434.1 glycosyl transferase [Streptomyces tanashiensis]